MRTLISLVVFLALLTGCIPSVERAEVQSTKEEIIVKDQHNNAIGHIEVYKFMYDEHRWICFTKSFLENTDFEVKHDPECPKCDEKQRKQQLD